MMHVSHWDPARENSMETHGQLDRVVTEKVPTPCVLECRVAHKTRVTSLTPPRRRHGATGRWGKQALRPGYGG
eukprot:scaffold39606_cov52-Phaeocystis_antarctica.AAC.1